MRDTRFIFVEGIMGSGKSTTADFLTEHLRQSHIPARFLGVFAIAAYIVTCIRFCYTVGEI